jgi:hypothetical protein
LTPEDQPEQLVKHQQQLTQQQNRTQHQQQLIQHQNLTQHQQSVQHKQHQLKQHQKQAQLLTSSVYEQEGFPRQLMHHQQLPQPHSLTTDQFGSLIKVIKKTQLLKIELMTIFF